MKLWLNSSLLEERIIGSYNDFVAVFHSNLNELENERYIFPFKRNRENHRRLERYTWRAMGRRHDCKRIAWLEDVVHFFFSSGKVILQSAKRTWHKLKVRHYYFNTISNRNATMRHHVLVGPMLLLILIRTSKAPELKLQPFCTVHRDPECTPTSQFWA